jgi:hypothetical protein
MLRNTLSVLIGLCFAGVLSAQERSTNPFDNQPKGIIYNSESAFNLSMATNRSILLGWEKGKLRTYYKTTFYRISLGELRSPREVRQSAPPQTRYRSYVFGKQNNLVMLRGGWGVKRYYSEKAKVKGVALGMSYSFGPSLGLVKPYYLALARVSPDNPGAFSLRIEKLTDTNGDVFLDNSRIYGAAPYTRGFSEISLLPGANAAIAFHMDWGAFDENVKALEIGAMLDAFPRAAPILVEEASNSPIYLNFFVNFQFGKRK